VVSLFGLSSFSIIGIWQFFILLMAIGVGYYFFYILPAGEKRDEADCEDERR
jgi:hypothetical protein